MTRTAASLTVTALQMRERAAYYAQRYLDCRAVGAEPSTLRALSTNADSFARMAAACAASARAADR